MEIQRITVGRQEAARLLDVSVTVVDEARRSGALASRKWGQRVLIDYDELIRFAQSLPSYEPR